MHPKAGYVFFDFSFEYAIDSYSVPFATHSRRRKLFFRHSEGAERIAENQSCMQFGRLETVASLIYNIIKVFYAERFVAIGNFEACK